MVKRDGLVDKLVVRADGAGQVSHAGSELLAGVADRVGLTRGLSAAMAPTRERRSAHDPGVVLRDLAVMLADGGECLADLGALRDQPDLFAGVPSDSTAFRVIDSVDEACLGRLRGAVAVARARARALGARPQRGGEQQGPELTVLDVDATLTSAHSAKQQAHGNFKGGYGHHPLLCYLDGTGEAPAGILRPGNAGSNTAADHIAVLDLALEQLDPIALEGEILVRADGAGATHALTVFCREAGMRFSFGFDLDERVRDAIAGVPEAAWQRAIRADGSEREHSQVVEITDRVDLSAWPDGSRLIARRTKLKDGDQQSFADHDGYRLAVFLTDQRGHDAPRLDLTHRGHARVEDRIRQGKDCGLANLPFQSFDHNQAWLWLVMLAQDLVAWTQQLCLADDARAWELKRCSYVKQGAGMGAVTFIRAGLRGAVGEGSEGSACSSCQTRRARWRLRQRYASLRLLPSARLRARYARVTGSMRARVTAMRCSAQLSWRSPPRLSRWRSRRPEDAGIGAAPAWRAKCPSVGKRAAPAVRARKVAAVSVPQPRSASSPGARARTRSRSSRSSWATARVSSRMRRSSSRATRTRTVCSLAASRRAMRCSQHARSSAPAGTAASSSGQSSTSCQRSRFCIRVRSATSALRWSSSSRISALCSSSHASGSVSRPSRSAARATAWASISSDLPG